MAERPNLQDLLFLAKDDYERSLRTATDLQGRGDVGQAEAMLVGLATMRPGDVRAIKLLGSVLARGGKPEAATAVYEWASSVDPDDPYVLIALGELKLNAGNVDSAVLVFERLFELDPEGKHPAANRGRELVQQFYLNAVETD